MKNKILVQNIETFEKVTSLTVDEEIGWTITKRVDSYLKKNESKWGIVSLDDDADGEYLAVLLVAPVEGPDYEMDTITGEMEPVVKTTNWNDIMPGGLGNQRKVQKEAIIQAIDTIEAAKAEKQTLPAASDDDEETSIITKPAKAAKSRKSKAKSNTQSKNTQSKGAPMSTTNQTKSIRNFEILCAFIEANPGVSRTDVFNDAGLQKSLRTPAQIKAIAAGDKLEVKRWNRRLNFLIRESGRQGVEIQIERTGRIAAYTIVAGGGQLQLPFDESDVVIERPAVDPKRADEEANQMLSFESLLATLDADEATITSDDQVALEEAQKMLK